MSKTHKGRYLPRNPEKYKGDPSNIQYRSSWERTFMKWLDLNEKVRDWASEEVAVPYFDPVQKKWRSYYPDFMVRYVASDGLIITEMVEIKPYAETQQPKKNPQRRTKSWEYSVYTYINNQAKWEAAKKFCEDKGIRFRIVTEYELGLKKKK